MRYLHLLSRMTRHPLRSTLFPYTTLFRSDIDRHVEAAQPIAEIPRIAIGGHDQIRLRGDDPLQVRAAEAAHLRQLQPPGPRSEEHTSELQSLRHLVCRLLLEKKKKEKERR